jgi:hypothetical protein
MRKANVWKPQRQREVTGETFPWQGKAEIAHIESRGREISAKIDDPSMELSTPIRFNRERSELEAYLKGCAIRRNHVRQIRPNRRHNILTLAGTT